MSDNSGAVQTQYTYEPFGKTTVSGATSGNANAFTGRELDETGLYFYRARYYDPSIGRFNSEDPMGFASSPNFYAYADDRPVNATDPTGLIVRVCTRPAELPIPASRHAYLYWAGHGTCGRGTKSGIEEPSAPGTICVDVPGSDGHEDKIMKCCNKTSDQGGWRPLKNDCFNAAERCLRKEGLQMPALPGGLGGRACASCNTTIPEDLGNGIEP